jgi:hypothetical protein
MEGRRWKRRWRGWLWGGDMMLGVVGKRDVITLRVLTIEFTGKADGR